jgi:phytoene synthase
VSRVGGPGDLPSRAAIVATAQESIARGSRSFAAASRLFDRRTRERAWLLYAWCRRCDDLADGQDHGHELSVVADPEARLARIALLTEAALAGEVVGDPAFDALRIVVAETAMPPHFARDVVEGFRLDLEDWRPRSEKDLYRYCYHVAGAVGCMMAIVMGVPPGATDTIDRASDLGIAFQLANIARDIEEDDRGGRCYLPDDWLVEMDMPPGQHMKPPFRSRLSVLARWLVEYAAEYEASAMVGAARLPFRSAWAVMAAAGIYGEIGRQVVKAGDHAWDHRISTPATAKIGWIATAWWRAIRRRSLYPDDERDSRRWTRPR